jgi:glycosyltransferase involved in cell wall biosynthesis
MASTAAPTIRRTGSLTFSIGIPTFNQADTLAQTLDSLLTQTRLPDEIVVSDHYSTDHTQQVISRYADRIPKLGIGFRSVQPPPGVNLTGQFNFTLSSLSGDWITLFSSDDIARPAYCETLMRGAATKPDAGLPPPVLVRSGWQQIDAQGKVVTTNYLLSATKVQAPPDNLTAQKHGPRVNFSAFAIKREAWIQSGPILSSIESLADWVLFLQVTPFGSYVYEHALTSGYRVGHSGNKFRDRLPMWTRDQQRVFRDVMPLAAERCGLTDLRWIQESNRYNFLRYLARASHEFAPNEREPIVPLFRSWADSLDSNAGRAPLEAFANGAVVPTSLPLSRRLKNVVRPLLQRFHNVTRRS